VTQGWNFTAAPCNPHPNALPRTLLWTQNKAIYDRMGLNSSATELIVWALGTGHREHLRARMTVGISNPKIHSCTTSFNRKAPNQPMSQPGSWCSCSNVTTLAMGEWKSENGKERKNWHVESGKSKNEDPIETHGSPKHCAEANTFRASKGRVGTKS
jgi:hypothetical protein